MSNPAVTQKGDIFAQILLPPSVRIRVQHTKHKVKLLSSFQPAIEDYDGRFATR